MNENTLNPLPQEERASSIFTNRKQRSLKVQQVCIKTGRYKKLGQVYHPQP